MPFQPVANTTELVLFGQQFGQDRISVLHYRWPGSPPTTVQLLAALDDFIARVLPSIEAAAHTSVSWSSVKMTNIHAANGATASRTLIGPYVGQRTGVASPGNVSLCLSKRTGLVGRRYHGRYYSYGSVNGDFNSDVLQSALAALLATVASKLQLELASAGTQFLPAVASRVNGSSALLTAVLFNTIADSMRRRLVSRGR